MTTYTITDGQAIAYLLDTGDTPTVQSDGASEGSVISGGQETIRAGGSGFTDAVLSGGTQTISSGGTALEAFIFTGTQTVYGTATGTTISGGTQFVSSGGATTSNRRGRRGPPYETASAPLALLRGRWSRQRSDPHGRPTLPERPAASPSSHPRDGQRPHRFPDPGSRTAGALLERQDKKKGRDNSTLGRRSKTHQLGIG